MIEVDGVQKFPGDNFDLKTKRQTNKEIKKTRIEFI